MAQNPPGSVVLNVEESKTPVVVTYNEKTVKVRQEYQNATLPPTILIVTDILLCALYLICYALYLTHRSKIIRYEWTQVVWQTFNPIGFLLLLGMTGFLIWKGITWGSILERIFPVTLIHWIIWMCIVATGLMFSPQLDSVDFKDGVILGWFVIYWLANSFFTFLCFWLLYWLSAVASSMTLVSQFMSGGALGGALGGDKAGQQLAKALDDIKKKEKELNDTVQHNKALSQQVTQLQDENDENKKNIQEMREQHSKLAAMDESDGKELQKAKEKIEQLEAQVRNGGSGGSGDPDLQDKHNHLKSNYDKLNDEHARCGPIIDGLRKDLDNHRSAADHEVVENIIQQSRDKLKSLKYQLGCKIVDGPQNGTLITEIKPNLAASRGGLVDGDVVEKINNVSVPDKPEFHAEIAKVSPGETFSMDIVRNQGKTGEEKLVLNLVMGAAGTPFDEVVKIRRLAAGTVMQPDIDEYKTANGL